MHDNELTLPVLNPVETSKALNNGALLLTASQALAVDWKRRQVTGNHVEVCETPALFAWTAWLNQLLAEQSNMPLALNRIQEVWLWEQVIRTDLSQKTDLSGQSQASLRGLARHARDAYALIQEYCIDVDELKHAGIESDAMLRWISAVHTRLDEGALQGRILLADSAQYVLQALNMPDALSQFGSIARFEIIVLAGFDVWTPMQLKVLSALQRLGVDVVQCNEDCKPAASRLYVCDDVQAEYKHIALQVQVLLEANPHARIAIASSDALNDVTALKRVLNEQLMPELRGDPSSTMQAVVCNADALSEMPMIRQLLHVLSLAGEFRLSFDAFSRLLFSPWLKGFEAERFGRAALDATFRQQNRHRMTFKSLMNTKDVLVLPQLLALIKVLAAWDKKRRSANDWVEAVHQLLKATGFVQASSDHTTQRSNHDVRQMNAFRDVLISLVAIDAIGETDAEYKISWMQFLSLLRSSCSDVRLVQQAKYNNVQLMPLAQISGLQFDHVFVIAMDEESFPPSARPYPLLPVSVQRKYALPMSHGAVVFEASEYVWSALLQTAPHVDISYAKQRDDKELLASSFVTDLEAQPGAVPETARMALEMEAFDDVSDVPLALDRTADQTGSPTVKGGASIIKNQSACPFRAFATHRLGIVALDETSPGIEPSSKGSLLHLALEYIWRQLQNQSALAALTDEALLLLIDTAIDHAWHEAFVVADSRTREYEQKRMRTVLQEWLALELQRPNFKVLAIEQEYRLCLPEASDQHFVVKIKADRMDVDASGRKLLIDYKTGARQSTATWLVSEMDDRIAEPQLPQYALAAGLGVDDAVSFARVRSGDMSFEGLCGDDMGIKGIVPCDGKRSAPDDWQAVLDDWKTYINALATEFVEGRCDVSPRDTKACDYCGFEAICRIDEMNVAAKAGDDS